MKSRRVINYLIIIVLGIIAVVAATLVIRDVRAYMLASKSYENVSENVTIGNNGGAKGKDTFDHFWYPDLQINNEALTKINSDYVGWIYVPALADYPLGKTGYPIAASKNNEEYLHTMFDLSQSPSGSIFLDEVATKDFTDNVTYIFGHNMKNRTMFGSLKIFSQEENLAASNPYVYIYTPTEVLKYEIFSYYVVSRQDKDAYADIGDPKDYPEGSEVLRYEDYIQQALSKTPYKYNKEHIHFEEEPKLLTLSTCYGTGHTSNFIVHTAMVGRMNIETESR